jgi:hypothetical protein
MAGKIEQCVCIKFCVKLGKSATKTLEMLNEKPKLSKLSQHFFFDLVRELSYSSGMIYSFSDGDSNP